MAKNILIFVMVVKLTTATSSSNSNEEQHGFSINKVRPQHHPLVYFSNDSVRCFCNLPSCVSTGYMCKSAIGGCFSNFLDLHSRDYRGRHGCLELLNDKEHRKWCEENPKDTTRILHRKKNDSKSLISCCYSDLCNHVDGQQTRSLINSTLLGLFNDKSANQPEQQESNGYTDSEVWFRAATIAVPICGACILFLLIVVAVKILRSENQNSTNQKLGPLYIHHHDLSRQSKNHCDKYNEYENMFRKPYKNRLYEQEDNIQKVHHVPLLPPIDGGESGVGGGGSKNETNAKLNLIHCESNYMDTSGKSILLDIEKETKISEVNFVKYNINEKNFRKS